MLKKALSLLLAVALIHLVNGRVSGQTTTGNPDQLTEKVKAQILHLGVGEKSRVKVELLDHTKLAGYISRAGDESFEVVNKTGAATTISYENVAKASGHGLSTGTKIAIGVGIAAVVFAVLIIIAVASTPTFGS